MNSPAKRAYTYHKDGRVCKFHIGDLIRYEKKNKIKDNAKLDTFVCTGIRFGKDDDEQILSNGTKEKRRSFVLCCGLAHTLCCVQSIYFLI